MTNKDSRGKDIREGEAYCGIRVPSESLGSKFREKREDLIRMGLDGN
jgi:hypothetical protein